MQWTGIATTCVVVTTLIGCLSVYILIQALQREERIARTGRYALITGYQRFARLYVRNARFTYIAMIVGMLIVLEAPIISTTNFDALYTFYNGNILVMFGITLVIAGIAILVAITVYTVLRSLYVDAPALKLFRVSNISKADVFSYTLKRELAVRFVLVLLFEMIAWFTIIGAIYLLWLPFVIGIALLLVRVNRGKQIYMWSNASVPLSQTQWAAMEPRVREWASRVGVEIEDVRLLSPAQVGANMAVLVGLRRPMLFLTEFFLRQTDWRQHDALVVHSLLMAKRKVIRYSVIRATVQVLIFILFLILIVLSITGSDNFFILGLVLLAVYFVFLNIYRKRLIALYLDVDRQSIGYTGDPFALMVTHNSVGVVSPRQAGGAVLQIRNLEALMQRPMPRAPWSRVLVASAIPMMRNGYAYSVPLSEALPLEPVERRLE